MPPTPGPAGRTVLAGACLLLAAPLGARTETGVGGFRIQLAPAHRQALLDVLERSARRLERPDCRRVFEDFHDGARRPLQTRLDALGLSAPEYMRVVVFVDAAAHPRCRNDDVLAVAAPGSRVVGICTPQFNQKHAWQRERVEAVMIHEALHTLGLGEDPPTSAEITARVLDRCGD